MFPNTQAVGLYFTSDTNLHNWQTQVKMPCKITEELNSLHSVLLHRLSISRFLLVTQSEYHTKYIHSLFNNSIHNTYLTQLNSSQSFSNIPTFLNQFHSSRFFRITLQHAFVYRRTVLSSWIYFNAILSCLTSNITAYFYQDILMFLLCQITEIPYFSNLLM